MASQVVSIYAINLVSDNNMFDKESKQIEKKIKSRCIFIFGILKKTNLKCSLRVVNLNNCFVFELFYFQIPEILEDTI